MLAGLTEVDKFYGSQLVLEDVNFAVNPGDRIALVGRNGSGKSTIIKLLAGLEEPNGGKVVLAPGLSIRMLAQDPVFDDASTIRSIVEGAFTELDAIESEMKELEPHLEDMGVLEKYHELEEHYQLRGGYAKNSRRDIVLSSLGFTGREDELTGRLSGGERTRLGLAQILVAQPELLLLDEPTNHLDIVMLEWLEGFLKNYPGAVLIVSHDRAFLDNVATETVLVTRTRVRRYPGNYSTYKIARDAELEILANTHENEKKELGRLEAMTAQMKIWGGRNEKNAIRARSMQKRVDRYESDMVDAPPPGEKIARVSFPCGESSEIVLQAGYISKSFGGRQLFKDLDFTVRRGERIAVLGRNGAGKSTLVKTMLGMMASDNARGSQRLGSRVKVGYYDQQLRGVNPENTLFKEVKEYFESDQQVHDILGAYTFPYDAQYKLVKNLSGGERARLSLLKLSLEKNNLLVLDEPTNHLDMEMLESLEKALLQFQGTLIMVSHDRRFIENLANQVWLLEEGEFYSYPGGWEYYKLKHKAVVAELEPEIEVKPVVAQKPVPKAMNPWKLKAAITELEKRILILETEQTAIAAELSNPTATSNFAKLGKRSSEIEAELLEIMAKWEENSSLLEVASSK